MANAPVSDPRMMVGKYVGAPGRKRGSHDYSDGAAEGAINMRNQEAYETANENAAYMRSLTPNAYQSRQNSLQAQMDADAREREQYDLALARRKDGIAPSEAGRQFDVKTNMFRELLARKMPDFFGGGMGGPPQPGGGMTGFSMGGQFGGQADAGLDQATRNYLLRFLR